MPDHGCREEKSEQPLRRLFDFIRTSRDVLVDEWAARVQTLSNLLGNAKKFCPAGGTITVRARVSANEVECSVSDTGPGIPEKDMVHIFDPYWSAKHVKKKGVGLGLFISKGIVEAHGGRIWVDNRPGAGVTFHVALPLA